MSIEIEKRTIKAMIEIYCKKNHGTPALCDMCIDLLTYANKRLDFCAFGDYKPSCKKCKANCYSEKKREKIKEVMRFSGKRILLKNPCLSIKHLIRF
ncbi:MAG TPA: nitrous oxide-stimulated promoter family protein [Bacteroidales bacterium]|nr:nitrous oxide-stimulated promoter family protein [Bacteroidales bacterium]HPS17703.1 nitrous oxide-stimulated promoter family protein [Bacteroidales bacterium]